MPDEKEESTGVFCEFCGDELEEGKGEFSERTGFLYCSTECMVDSEG